jgi:hypothetical protein
VRLLLGLLLVGVGWVVDHSPTNLGCLIIVGLLLLAIVFPWALLAIPVVWLLTGGLDPN